MIISQVEITNYKQYGGHHKIVFPQSGSVGVIGANGVGKTTLFEAIEWALYSPSTIKAAEVRPRTWRGKTEVKITVDEPATGARHIIERELGKGSAKARVYRVDQHGFEEKIMEGASQVTNWVEQTLIGLDHGAFVATFFTRQKELGFFNGSPTTRRRDVGKLLGLETIRTAQQIIAEERKRAQSDARSYREQSEHQLQARNFDAEISDATVRIDANAAMLAQATNAVDIATASVTKLETDLSHREQMRDQDTQLAERILQTERERDVSQQQTVGIQEQLDRLSNLATERERLAVIAATRPRLEAEEQAHATNRTVALRVQELQRQLDALDRRRDDATNSIAAAIAGAPAPDGNAAWDCANPEASVAWATSLRIEELAQQVELLDRARESQAQLDVERETLTKYEQRAETLRKEEAELLLHGDPATRAAELQEQLQALNASSAAAQTTITRINGELQKSQRVLTNLGTQKEGEVCPTCQRPFTAEDTEHAIAVFEAEISRQRILLEQTERIIADNRKQSQELTAQLRTVQEQQKTLTDRRASIETGNRYLQEQENKVSRQLEVLQALLQQLNRNKAPEAPECERARRELVQWRSLVNAAEVVQRALRSQQQIGTERVPLEQELQSIGAVEYDEQAHRLIIEQLQKARQSETDIARIDAELSHRDERIERQQQVQIALAQAISTVESLVAEKSALAFDVSEYQSTQHELRTARESQKGAIEQHHQAEVTLQAARHVLGTIEAEKTRVEKLALEAESKQREADDLDTMYREFTEFERFAAAWYAPRLSEITSELVSQVTDGKYDRVEFDSNFSIEVYDRSDEKYPYETFSGGERDAIALCARIALSRVIGGTSTTPPGFLVLDEVFGSLDLARRQQLLEMLGAITGVDDFFRQVFIISHVDDVRTSPILDEVWRVAETDDGTSELQVLGIGEDIGEL